MIGTEGADMKKFTIEELSRYDGREGRPAFIAYGGKVYDVTESFLWKGGRHMAAHQAGSDLTDDLGKAPHGTDLLDRVPVIGLLDTDTGGGT